MAGPDDKKPGMIGQVLPFLLVAVMGAGAGFAGFKMVGVPVPKPAGAEKPAAAAKPEAAASAEKPAEKPAAHGEQKGAASEEADKKAREAALLEEEQKARKMMLAETNIVPLTPIIANLANPSTTWIRMEGALAVSKTATAKPADISQAVSARIMAYLKTLKITDVQSASGMEFINTDINEIARTATGGDAKSVFITGFVVE